MNPKPVLVVDDKDENLYLLSVILQSNGFTVTESRNGKEALACARQELPQLIIADILMPVMDGFALCREWKSDPVLKSVPFIFYTATYTDDRDRDFAMSLGAERFIVKPSEPDEFMKIVHDVLREVMDSEQKAESGIGDPEAPANAPEDGNGDVYLKQYNEVLVHKLESKMEKLELTNRLLEQDIAERLKTEESLRESESRISIITQTARDAIMMIDSEGRVSFWNRAAIQLFGYTEEEILSKELHSLIVPEHYYPAFEKGFKEFLLSGTGNAIGKTLELMAKHKDGHEVPVEISLSSIQIGGKWNAVGIVRDITIRKRREKIINDQAQIHLAMIQAIPDAILRLNRKGVCLEYHKAKGNGNTGQIDIQVGKNIRDIFPPELEKQWRKSIKVAFQDESLQTIEYSLLDTQGILQTYEARIAPCGWDEITAIIRNVTEIRTADKNLRESEQRLQLAIKATGAGLWDWNIKDGTDFYSSSWLDLLGYTVDDVKGQVEFWKRTVHPDDLKLVEDALMKHVRGEAATYEIEYRKIKKSGECIWVMDLGRVVEHTPDGKPQRMIGTIIDITDRRRYSEERNRLITAIEQVSESIVITDLQGNIEYVNPYTTIASEYSTSELIGHNPRILSSGKHDTAFYQAMWNELIHGRVWHGILTNRKKNGELYEEDVTISPVKDASGAILNYIAVKRDITHELQLETQLHQSQKLEAIGRLAGGVAHDFNNMLTVVSAHAELISLKLHAQDPIHSEINLIRKMVERGSALTRQLLAFSRRLPAQSKIVNLNDILKGMSNMLPRLVAENIAIEYRLDPSLPNIRADLGQIEQVVMNIVVNARDAMPGGGKLLIATKTIDADKITSAFTQSLPPGHYVSLEIADTGTGIPKDVLPHIFEPFYTTKPVGVGTGLGLSTVLGIVKQSSGEIEIESEMDVGTIFRVFLPAVTNQKESESTVESVSVRGGKETILIVEDEAHILNLMSTILQSRGYNVLTADNGMAAIDLFKATDEPIQLIVTDVIMPKLDGTAMVDLLKSEGNSSKVLYMSGYTTENFIHRIQDTGSPFLPKPFNSQELLKAVRNALDE
jgi:two-component system, cell cycle sensor histidine kinase and response regulator CckA